MRRMTHLRAVVALSAAVALCAGCEPDPWWTDRDANWITTYGSDQRRVPRKEGVRVTRG